MIRRLTKYFGKSRGRDKKYSEDKKGMTIGEVKKHLRGSADSKIAYLNDVLRKRVL